MQDKHKNLLLYLYNKNGWTTAKILSSALNVSVRTIKNYIKQINSVQNDIVLSSKEGYLFNQAYKSLLEQKEEKAIPQTSKERSVYLLNYLLQSNTPINFYDLCDDLYISESTLKSDLKSIRKKVYEMDLQLQTKSNYVQIVGIEKNKRKLLSKLLYEESNSNFLDLRTIENAFPNIDITFIDQVMIRIFNKYHWFINDYSKINILLHTTIAIDRLKADETYTPMILSKEQNTTKEYQIANDIGKRLASHFRVSFDQSEIYELSLLINSYTTNINYQEATLENIQKIVGKESYELAKDVINDISRYFYIDLNEPQFFIRFVLHVFNLTRRAQNNIIINNPLAANIKERCPLIYECAVTASHLIQERINYPITDDEIGYIAFHIGGALEAQKKIEDIINVVLLFPQYYDLDQSLASLIEKKFKDEILVKNVIASEEMIHEQNCDLVLSMIPTNHIYDKPVLIITPFLQDRDLDNISNELNKIKSEKKQKEFERLVDYMLNENMFYIDKKFTNRDEAIDFMANILEENGYVTSYYKKEVLHREQISSTAFGKIAIPHEMKLNAKKSGMCLILNDDKHKIPWAGTEVNVVLMLAISKSDRKMFLDLFDSLTMILTEDENISKLISTSSYKEFKNMLVRLS